MKVIGIIAEFNPLHEGHKYLLSQANQLGEYVIVALSGNFVQRGIPAVRDKYERTIDALKNGAHMVIEMPLVGATSSAREFARCGVGVLSSTGLTDSLLFGSESGDLTALRECADILENENPDYKLALKSHLARGESYPASRILALKYIGVSGDILSILESPNNILATEYLLAIKNLKSDLSPLALLRDFSFDSSSIIRKKLNPKDYVFPRDFSLLLNRELLSRDDFSDFLESNPEISNRIIKNRNNFSDFTEFADLLKAKNLTHSRIMRILCHILLNVKQNDLTILKELSYAPYIHVLGIKKEAQILLSKMKDLSPVPVFTSVLEGEELLKDSPALCLFKKDVFAHDLYKAVTTQKAGMPSPNQRSHKFIVL